MKKKAIPGVLIKKNCVEEKLNEWIASEEGQECVKSIIYGGPQYQYTKLQMVERGLEIAFIAGAKSAKEIIFETIEKEH